MPLAAYRIFWTEHESGWGQRPDGTSLHKDKAAAEAFIEAHWARYPNPRGNPPPDYSAPGTITLVEVSQEVHDELERVGSFWASPNRWLKDDELSVPMKKTEAAG